jgi:addiction module HigA family antidote
MSKSQTTIVEVNIRPVHPGEILKEELGELGLSANQFAKALNVPANRISGILAGRRGVSADTALRLAQYFGTTPDVWMGMQAEFDLATVRREKGQEIARTVQQRAA